MEQLQIKTISRIEVANDKLYAVKSDGVIDVVLSNNRYIVIPDDCTDIDYCDIYTCIDDVVGSIKMKSRIS